MPAPDAIFIDTCIFDGQQLDFAGPQLAEMVEAAKGKSIRLLLPHPTSLEIARHIREKAAEAAVALHATRRKHPVLRHQEGLPNSDNEEAALSGDLRRRLEKYWKEFLANFDVVELDYTGIDVCEIMGLYDRGEPPFGTGQKRKEFPDAFAFAALKNYAVKKGHQIAVISEDKDFQAACETVPQLHHFPYLRSFTTSLLKEEAQFEAATKLAKEATPLLLAEIKSQFPELRFEHEIDPDGRSHVQNVEVTDFDIDAAGVNIVGLQHEAYTISFLARVSFTAWAKHVADDSWISDGERGVMYLHDCEGKVEDEAEIECIARIATNANWSVNERIVWFRIEEDYIDVTTSAPEVDDRNPNDWQD